MSSNRSRTLTNLRTSSKGNLEKDTRKTNDGRIVDCVALVHVPESPTEPSHVRHPSPYYYGDLFKVPDIPRPQNKYRKSLSLDVPDEHSKTLGLHKRNSVAGDENGSPFAVQGQPQNQNQDLVSPTSGSEHAIQRNEILSGSIITEWDQSLMPPTRLLSNDLPSNVCTCIPSNEEDELETKKPQVARQKVRKLRKPRKIDPQPILVEDEDDEEGEVEDEEEEMARQRHLYETAFDCKISRSDDDLDDLDRVINHPILHSQVGNEFVLRRKHLICFQFVLYFL